jgi:hypothetical protein
MAIPKKGSRNIVVDGVGYRWNVRRRPTYDQEIGNSPFILAVEHAEESGQVLIVHLPQPHPAWFLHTDSVIPVKPSDVESHIREALAAGWKPTEPGKSFEM